MDEHSRLVYDRLAKIIDGQQLLHAKLMELDDGILRSRIMQEASEWVVGTSAEDEEQLLAQHKHSLESLEHVRTETKRIMTAHDRVRLAIRSLRRHLGNNNFKISKGTEPKMFGGAVDPIGPRAKEANHLLSCQDRQFNVARMLTELDSEDVRKNYQTFTERFADGWTQKNWVKEVCIEYEKGLTKQEKMVSDALERERQHKATAQRFGSLERSPIAGKPLRSPLPPYPAGSGENQDSQHQTKTRGCYTERFAPSPSDLREWHK